MKIMASIEHRFTHVKSRLKERMNIDINMSEYLRLCEQLRMTPPFKIKSKNRDYRAIQYLGRYIVFGYNKKYSLINTAYRHKIKKHQS